MKKQYFCFSLLLFSICVSLLNEASAQYAWKVRANFGGDVRNACIAFSIGNYGYIGAGEQDVNDKRKDFWQYDPTSNAWTQQADIPITNNVAGNFVINGKGYMVCGCTDPGYTLIADLWMYDPSTNSWTAKASFPGVNRYGGAGFAIGNKGYYGMGNTGTNLGPYYVDFYEYDPAADSWTQKADFPGAPRYQSYGIALNGKGYAGFGHDENIPKFYYDWWQYDPVADVWTAKADYPGTIGSYPTGFVINNLIYIGTGFNGVCTSDFYEYNPTTDTWAQKQNYGAGARFEVSGFSIGNIGYFGTGTDLTNNYNEFWEYAPTAPPTAAFQASDSSICANDCIGFTDHSVNADTWYWFFQGASPFISTEENPQNVCYQSPGSYDVALIVSGSGGSDTLYMTKYITVNPNPPTPVIRQVNDTLYCTTDSTYISYQWYYSNALIQGATDTFLIAAYSGNYNVKVTNTNGCSVAVGINVILGLKEMESNPPFTIYPNPAGSKLNIEMLKPFHQAEIELYDVCGRRIFFKSVDSSYGMNLPVDLTGCLKGIYFLVLTADDKKFIEKIIKSD